MQLTAKRLVPARHDPAVSRPVDVRSSVSRRILFASGVALLCGLSAGCSTVSPETVADAKPAAAEPASTAAASTAATTPVAVSVTTVTSANGTDRPYVQNGQTYRPAARKPGKVGVGLASWYGEGFQGRRTANGETFDMTGFTAAHPTLPLPSYVRVTNVQNGRSMVVRVNDRGPFHKNRLLDVSKRTADMLGFRGAGVGNVKVDYIGPAPSSRDDRRMLATYQEFGRPAAPAGMQVVSLAPVSDAALAAESGQPASVVQTLVASAASGATAVKESVVAVAKAIPLPAAAVAKPAPVSVAAATPAKAAVHAEPELASVGLSKPVSTAPGQQTPAAALAAASRPSAPAAKAAPAMVASAEPKAPDAAPHKRVVQPAAPVLASSTPELAHPAAPTRVAEAPAPVVNVSSRIASSFEAFGSSPFGQSGAPQAPGLAYNGVR